MTRIPADRRRVSGFSSTSRLPSRATSRPLSHDESNRLGWVLLNAFTAVCWSVAQISVTVALVGLHHTPGDRLSSWPGWCCVAVVSALLTLQSARWATRLSSRPRLNAKVTREQEQAAEVERALRYGPLVDARLRRVPFLMTLPVMSACLSTQPDDVPQGPTIVATSLFLAVLITIISMLTGRFEGYTGLAAWTVWAGFAQAGMLDAAVIAGFAGLVTVVAATIVGAVRTRNRPRQHRRY